jgi:glycosyltransferase involved in cell wall biosynthesis
MSPVTAVIPTIGRPDVYRALASVRRQTLATEIVVVWDGAGDPPAELTDLDDVTLVRTPGAAGGGFARNLGVAAASTPYVAFLDDDDEWLPTKSEQQVAVAQTLIANGRRPIVSCQSYTRASGTDQLTDAVPARTYVDGPVEDYLFQGRALGFQRPAVHVPTMLTTTSLARDVEWDPSLRRHQDWDWLLRATNAADVVLHQIAEPLAIVDIGSPASVSASSDWVTTWEWGRRWKHTWSPQTYSDFMFGQTVRQSLVAGDRVAALMAAREGVSASWPSARTAALGFSAVVPRSLLAKVAQSIGARKTSTAPVADDRVEAMR